MANMMAQPMCMLFRWLLFLWMIPSLLLGFTPHHPKAVIGSDSAILVRHTSYRTKGGCCRHHSNSMPILFMSLPTSLDTFTSGLASLCRLPKGVNVDTAVVTTSTKPSIILKRLYDIENSLACKKVRERITELDLVVDVVIPAAKNSRALSSPLSNYEYKLDLDQPTTIPQLVVAVESSETGEEERTTLVGDEDILAYLNSKFPSNPTAKTPTTTTTTDDDDGFDFEWLRDALGVVSTFLRLGRGVEVCSAASATRSTVPRPQQPLILYSYEGNQFCRLVREVLTELDLPYQLRSAGKGSPRRQELAALTGNGSTICPYLVDPNTQTQMAESRDIIRYLYKTYALWTPPYELLRFGSDVVVPLIGPVFRALAPLQAQWSSSSSDPSQLDEDMERAMSQIEQEIEQNPVVVYTYQLSPFSLEARSLLENLGIEYKEISLGLEFTPGLLAEPHKRAALLKLTGQSSLPHVFIGGKSIGGLFSGTPGLVPALEQDKLQGFLEAAGIPSPLSGSSSSSAALSSSPSTAAAVAEASAETLGSFE